MITDQLTGLISKEDLICQIEDLINNNETFSFVLADLDFFKPINDQYGHQMGDRYIAKAAELIQKNLRSQDIIGRYGGEEFGILMPNTFPESAFVFMEDIRRLLSDREYTFQYEDQKLTRPIHFSAGIASFPRDGKYAADVIRAADEALYRAKVAGRQRIVLAMTEKMKTKTSYYTLAQLERLAFLSNSLEKSESVLLREALDDLLQKYGG